MTDGIFQGRDKQKVGKDNQVINQKGGIHCSFKTMKVMKNKLKPKFTKLSEKAASAGSRDTCY